MKNSIEGYYMEELRKNPEGVSPDVIKQILNEKRDAEQFLNLIAPEYMGVYVVDRDTDYFRIITAPDYFREIAREKYGRYTQALEHYRDQYVVEADRDIFSGLLDYDVVYRTLWAGDEMNLSYRRMDGIHVSLRIRRYSQLEEEKNLSVWIYTDEKLKDELKKALEEMQVKNEILSAIGKSYFYISRIDLEADYYEVISGLENFHGGIQKEGKFSSGTPENCEKIIAAAYLDDFLKFIDPATIPERLKEEESVSMEYRLLDGGWHRARLIVKKRNAEGRVTHVLCAVRNISDEKRIERQLAQKAAEAEHEVLEKNRFLSNMSHDIRTPMNGILGMLDIAEQYPADSEVQKKCRHKMRELTGYLVSIVNNVLDMNKLQSDDFVMLDAPFELTDMLHAANETAQIKAEEKGITYRIDWEKSRMRHRHLLGNAIYIAKILSIFSDNAIKFSESGSEIEVWCTETPINEETAGFAFYCRDHGCGMSPEFAKHAFDLFSQEDASSRTEYQGTGLGLAIAKGLADKLHGTIHLDSEKGVGTTASLEIVLKLCSEEDVEAAEPADAVSLEGMHVLLVEDNALNMQIARFLLEAQGMVVEAAADGREAVAMFEKSAPGYYGVILMDIMMPNLNGLDATRKIRSLNRADAESIPIIAMSANTFADDRIKSRLAGMNAHLAKPLDAKLLTNAITRCIKENTGNISY